MGNAVITLRDLMPVAHPEKTKIKFNMNARDVNVRAYDMLLKDTSTPEKTDSGSRWYEMNAWRSATGQANNNLNHADYLLSFAQYYTYGPEYFIFGGMHKVEKAVPEVLGGVGYKLTLLPDYEAYIKRLIIKLKKPIGRDIYNKFYENTMHDFEPVVYEYSMSLGNVAPFPGYKYVCIDHKTLQAVIASVGSDWYWALDNVKGVYCITDTATGKLYVGSASGDSKKDAGADLGIWQRWSAYANPMDPTGGNKEFKAIVAEHGTGYIMENFTYSILEVCDTKMTTAEVCERESHWKDVLCSRKFGMNWN